MYINLSGLNILVTGASAGIGKAVALKLGEAGACIGIHYNKNEIEADIIADTLDNGSKSFHADLSQEHEASVLFENVILEMETVDVLINCASISSPMGIEEEDSTWLENWEKVMMVNLHSPAILCKKSIQHFLKNDISGRIINICSSAAFHGTTAEHMPFASSKAGLNNLTKSIAKSFGKNGIKAFNVSPSITNPENFLEKKSDTANGDFVTKNAMERRTETKDIAPLIAFLTSGLVDHASGTTFDINGAAFLH